MAKLLEESERKWEPCSKKSKLEVMASYKTIQSIQSRLIRPPLINCLIRDYPMNTPHGQPMINSHHRKISSYLKANIVVLEQSETEAEN